MAVAGSWPGADDGTAVGPPTPTPARLSCRDRPKPPAVLEPVA